jgi:hypothetical protein
VLVGVAGGAAAHTSNVNSNRTWQRDLQIIRGLITESLEFKLGSSGRSQKNRLSRLLNGF